MEEAAAVSAAAGARLAAEEAAEAVAKEVLAAALGAALAEVLGVLDHQEDQESFTIFITVQEEMLFIRPAAQEVRPAAVRQSAFSF